MRTCIRTPDLRLCNVAESTFDSPTMCDEWPIPRVDFFLTPIIFFCRKGDSECHVWNDAVLVCSCNYITDHEIREVNNELLDEDCWQLIVPAKVYHAMGKRGRCCGCFPNVVDIIIQTTEEYHARHHSTEAEIFDFMSRLKQFHEENRRADIERRQKSHRAA